jgi:hypothetical protein
MSSLLKNLFVFGAGCAAGVYVRGRAHFKEAFTVGEMTVYYPYRLKNNPNEETLFERNKD